MLSEWIFFHAAASLCWIFHYSHSKSNYYPAETLMSAKMISTASYYLIKIAKTIKLESTVTPCNHHMKC